MKKIIRKLENIYAAAAFAEEGEFETAREIIREEERVRSSDRAEPGIKPRKQLRAPGTKR